MAYCRRCGKELVEGAAFCPQCGTQVAELEESQSSVPVANDAVSSPSERKPRKKGLVAAVVVAVVVVAVVVGAGIWWKSDQDAKAATAAQAEWEHTHVSLVTQVPLEAPEFDDASTSIPVQVKGTDLDGNSVEDLQFLKPGYAQVTTLPGSYNLVFPGGYFTGAGKVMRAPAQPVHVEVAVPDAEPGEPGAEGEGGDATAASDEAGAELETAVFSEVPPLELTDEIIEDVAKWAGQDPDDAGKAQTLSQTAAAAHEEAVAAEERRLAEEAARRAEEEARAREAAELQSVLANLEGWWVTGGQSGAIHDHIHGGVYEEFDDGIMTHSAAKKVNGGTVTVERASESVMAELGKIGETGYIVRMGGTGYLWLESEPDELTCYGYPPSIKSYSGTSSRFRRDPPAEVLAIA